MTLPYPEYSWNFTQHAIGLQPANLFPLLSAASLFENQSSIGDNINEILISQKTLTPNIRDGRPDAWRDYQQILSETGLIFSTKIQRNLKLTEAGRLLLQGELGISELMAIQALRYQYPNGLKSSFLVKQTEAHILIKPGTLILRLLLELLRADKAYHISIDQCQNFVLPVTINANWPVAFEKLSNSHSTDSNVHRHARRNIQDWFKFLATTDIFELTKVRNQEYITLSTKVLSNIDLYDYICTISEDLSNYWIPRDYSRQTLYSWFVHFGHIPTEYYDTLEIELDDSIISNNFVIPPSDDITDSREVIKSIELSSISRSGIKIDSSFDISKSLELVNSGYVKRREKTKLHDEIVNVLAKYCIEQGCTVFEDRNSIDLLVKNPKDEISIFEVKTATPRNIYPRMRLAVGQVLEYGYRYNQEFGESPKVNIALNLDMQYQRWLQTYMNEHLDIGVVSVLGNELKCYPNELLNI